jgi:hypothetical protein
LSIIFGAVLESWLSSLPLEIAWKKRWEISQNNPKGIWKLGPKDHFGKIYQAQVSWQLSHSVFKNLVLTCCFL